MGGTHTTAMNLNSATERELTQLPRIGADKARRIVRYRAIRKGFRDWADFAGTPGITAADGGNPDPGPDRAVAGGSLACVGSTADRSWSWQRGIKCGGVLAAGPRPRLRAPTKAEGSKRVMVPHTWDRSRTCRKGRRLITAFGVVGLIYGASLCISATSTGRAGHCSRPG